MSANRLIRITAEVSIDPDEVTAVEKGPIPEVAFVHLKGTKVRVDFPEGQPALSRVIAELNKYEGGDTE